jgi:putative endonuclease
MRRQGSDAEDLAADYLIDRGYTIVTRRYKAHSGELDLVALEGDALVFVEVKQRHSGMPEVAIGRVKIDRLFAAANEYCRANGIADRPFRFDVVAVDSEGIRHHRGAFADLADLDHVPVHIEDQEVDD